MNNKRLYIFVFIFLMFFCVNIGGVKADWCSSDSKFSKAVSCEYKAGVTVREDVVLYFGKTTGGAYCSTVKSVKVGTWVWAWTDDNSGGASKKKVEFDFVDADKMQSSIFENNKCPRLKIVNEYKISTGKTEKVIISNKKLSGIPVLGDIFDETACGLNQILPGTFGSECWMADGVYKEITKDEMTATTITTSNERTGNFNLIESIRRYFRNNNNGKTEFRKGEITCTELLGDDLINMINNFSLLICVLAIVLIIVFTSSDFIKAITSSDDDILKKATGRLKVRLISVVILLLLPALVNFTLGFINDKLYLYIVDDRGNIVEDKDVSIKVGKPSDCSRS